MSDAGTGPGPHHCPSCGAERAFSPRYPWHLCGGCLGTATDAGGRRLEFTNASFSGGLLWRHEGGAWSEDLPGVLCLVRGRPVVVREAHMGGVVAQPAGPFFRAGDMVDLTRG